MDRTGKWRLSPAFDLVYSFDPAGKYTKNHQCWLNGKNDDFEIADLLKFGRFCNLSEKQSRNILSRTGEAFSEFSALADEWELPASLKKTVEMNQRRHLFI